MHDIRIIVALLAGFFLSPIAHCAVRRTKWWGVRTIIAGLVFAPGLCAIAWILWLFVSEYDEFVRVTRWGLVYFLQGRGGLRCLAAINAITATYLGVCLLMEHFFRPPDRDEEGGTIRVVEAWRSLVAIQLALMAVAAYLYTYTRLEDAVTGDNLALAEKRLNWNLEGLGPNDGLIVWRGTAGLVRYPLLPVAVKNDNYDMVKLLVKHGADLNPKGWDAGGIGLPPGASLKNTLYCAVMNHDVEMMDLLIKLGANPERGIELALWKKDRGLLDFFLKKGVSVEFALGVAKQNHFSQQEIDTLFGDYISRSRVGAGQ